ncbi:MAG: putative metal-binding motif-containing protein [Myxococcales bacterium]|nr:putative metal-binding motif-containing protein [Myxococcales bacterium]
MRSSFVAATVSVLLALALGGACSPSVTVGSGSGGTGSGGTGSASDFDGDGYPAGPDCDDEDATVHPGQPEPCSCNGIDDDCNGIVDDFPCDLACVDQDGDGYPAGPDCDDADPAVHPGQEEPCACDGIDQDCSGVIDDFPCFLACDDQDGDGYPVGIDCNDLDPNVHPGPASEPCTCDGVDENCNGVVDDFACPFVCSYLGEGAVCVAGQEPACGEGLSCCYPCGIPDCDFVCVPTCTEPGCIGGCQLMG